MPTFGRRFHRIIIKTTLVLVIYLSLLFSRIVSQIPPKIIVIKPALASATQTILCPLLGFYRPFPCLISQVSGTPKPK